MKNKLTTNNFDLLRLFAAFQVVLMHATAHFEQPNLIASYLQLFPGVPIFFFLSGYLIYGSYESSLKNKNPLKNFYEKRVLRLYPGLWFCFLVSVLLVLISGYFDVTDIELRDFTLWTIAQTTFFQFYNPDFLRGFGVGVINGALWTISVELQFYFLTPFVHRILRQGKSIILSLIVIFIFFNIWNAYFNEKDTIILKLINVSFAPWFYMFLCGAFLARFKRYTDFILERNVYFILLAFVFCFWTAPYLGLTWGNTIHPIGFLFYLALALKLAYMNPSLSDKLLKRNDISYGIYIYHMPIINFILVEFGTGLIQFLCAIVATFIMATLSWFMLERPLLRKKKNELRKN